MGALMVRVTNTWGLIIKDFIIEIEEDEDCRKRRLANAKEIELM